jgi:hypothetical protein
MWQREEYMNLKNKLIEIIQSEKKKIEKINKGWGACGRYQNI